MARSGWPTKPFGDFLAQRDYDDAGTKLRNAEVRSIEEAPIGPVSQALEACFELLAVVFKDSAQQPANVFDHHCGGADDVNEIERRGEQIAFIRIAELLAGYRKGWARQPACKQFDALETSSILFNEVPQVFLEDVPVRAIQP